MVKSDKAVKLMKAAKWESAPESLKNILNDVKNNVLSKEKCTIKWSLKGKQQTLLNRSRILNSLDEFKDNVNKGYITGFTAIGPYTDFNEWRYIFKLPIETEYKMCIEMSKWLGGGWELRGCFGIPPGGFLGWHTNANALMPRMYFVWNDSDTSEFYVDTPKGIKVISESKGWRKNVFVPPAWHSGRTDGFRFSMGFRPSSRWTYKDTDEIKYLLKGTSIFKKINDGECCNIKECNAVNDYSIDGKNYSINMLKLEHLIDNKNLKRILINDIAYLNFNCKQTFCECCSNGRVDSADTTFPIILVKGINNYNKKYRSLDGKHRILKRISENKKDVKAFILDKKEVLKLLKEI